VSVEKKTKNKKQKNKKKKKQNQSSKAKRSMKENIPLEEERSDPEKHLRRIGSTVNLEEKRDQGGGDESEWMNGRENPNL
jgi:hypothetical protein